jgi:ABC-type sugar transport system ATPase subunit
VSDELAPFGSASQNVSTNGDGGGSPPSPVGESALVLAGIHKRFGGVHALRGAHLVISESGVVHGLIGENGSGKSTLLGILAGQLRPDAGGLVVAGEPLTFRSPVDALARGITLVSQEVAVAPDLSVAENILMGHRYAGSPFHIRWRDTNRRAAEVLEQLGVNVDPAMLVSRLRPDQRQLVEIARALSMDAKIMILDEPTSSLTTREVDALFNVIRTLKGRGVSMIFVSHRLSEFFEVVDELTVLRDGQTVAAGPVSAFDADTVVDAMIGAGSERSSQDRGTVPRSRNVGTVLALRVRDVEVAGLLGGVSLDVAPGEIVGLAGLGGAGRGELLECVFGVRHHDSGTIEIHGKPLGEGGARSAIASGVGYLPPDRKTDGLVLSMSVNDNLASALEMSRPRLGLPRRSDNAALTATTVQRLRIRATSGSVLVGSLSGGNQQKVALGKWLVAGSRLLLLDEPTRGVDVGSKAEIHALLRELADDGVGMLVSSSENEELLELCDRILVVFRGRVVADLSAKEANETTIARLASGLA